MLPSIREPSKGFDMARDKRLRLRLLVTAFISAVATLAMTVGAALADGGGPTLPH